jgi:histidine triad (HIT) family protein
MESDCPFCNVQRASPPSAVGVYDDDLVYAAHVVEESAPTYLGHLIVQTKRHVAGYAELSDDEATAVGLAIARLSRALKACTAAEKVYAVMFGEVVPHFHTHLTSRYPGTPPEYWRMNIENWPQAPRGEREAIVALCECLRNHRDLKTAPS